MVAVSVGGDSPSSCIDKGTLPSPSIPPGVGKRASGAGITSAYHYEQCKSKGPHLDRPEAFSPPCRVSAPGEPFRDTTRDNRTQSRGEGTILEGRDNSDNSDDSGYTPGTGHLPLAAIGAAARSEVPSGGGTLQATPAGTEVVAALALDSSPGLDRLPPPKSAVRAKRDSPGS